MIKYLTQIAFLTLFCSSNLLWGQENKNCDNIPPQYNLPENRVWAMGDSLGLDFNAPGGPTAISTYIHYNGASVADSNGQLLFCTNGLTVWNTNGVVMQNGLQLTGFALTPYGQTTQIIQVPYQSHRYYLFTIRGVSLYCNLIDLSLNNGQGAVVNSFALRGIILSGLWELANRIAAVSDCSRNAWLLVHDEYNAAFRAFHITTSGIDTVPVVSDFSNILPLANYGNGSIGNMVVSPNGKHLAMNCNINNTIWLTYYDFDPGTGQVSNPQILKRGNTNNMSMAAFSSDNSKLYCMALDSNSRFILQYDFNSSLPDSLITPDSVGLISNSSNSFLFFGGIRLGPDGKIYFGSRGMDNPDHGIAGFNAIGRINYPNNSGTACGFQDSVASVDLPALLPSGFFYGFFPTENVIPKSSLNIALHLQNDTLFAQPASYYSYHWYLNGSPVTGGNQTYLPIGDTGLYAVKVVDSACGCTDSVWYHLTEQPGMGIATVAAAHIRIYPNPANDKIFVASPQPLNLSLYDLTGRLLRQIEGKNQIDISAFSDGIYLLRIEDKQGRFVRVEKVVKRK